MNSSQVILILIFIIIIPIFILIILTYNKVKKLQLGSCAGVPPFNSNATYSKSITIPLINKTISGTAIFNPNNTFLLNFGSMGSFPNNTWTYDQENCALNVALDPNIQTTLSSYDCSVDTEVTLNRQGNLVVTGSILGILPISVTLDKA